MVKRLKKTIRLNMICFLFWHRFHLMYGYIFSWPMWPSCSFSSPYRGTINQTNGCIHEHSTLWNLSCAIRKSIQANVRILCTEFLHTRGGKSCSIHRMHLKATRSYWTACGSLLVHRQGKKIIEDIYSR